MKAMLAVLTGLALILVWFLIETVRMRQLTERTFSGRDLGTEDRVFRAHFESKSIPEEVFLGVRAAVANELSANASLLRADDNFMGNLRPLLGYEQMIDLAIIRDLENRFHMNLADSKLESCKTVRI